MNILFVCPEPPNHLNRNRALNVLKALCLDHNVHLIYLINSQNRKDQFDPSIFSKITEVQHPLRNSYINCMIRSPLPEPLEAAYCYSPAMQRAVEEIVRAEDIDVVYVKRTRMARYGLRLKNVVTILDMTDSMELHYSRTRQTVKWYKKPLYWEEWLKYRLYEKRMIREYDFGVVVSEIDKAFVEDRAKINNIRILPNLVDTNFFQPSNESSQPNTLLFSGLMNKHVNIDAARFLVQEIFPLIQEKIPDVKLYIVGPEPPQEILDFGNANIEVTGYVPDIREFIAKSSIVLVPIRVGAGTRQKILQAMSMEKAIVSTTMGAEGIIDCSPENIRIEDDPKQFAMTVVNLLGNRSLRAEMGQAGRRLVEKHYSIQAFQDGLCQIFNEDVLPLLEEKRAYTVDKQ